MAQTSSGPVNAELGNELRTGTRMNSANRRGSRLPAMLSHPMRRAFFGCLVSMLALLAGPARAWGDLGHRLVGQLAQPLLTPKAAAGVAELLSGEPDPTLAGIANWADTLRASEPDRFHATSRWHYVNFPQGSCRFDAQRDCKDGDCVVRAIETQRRLLADRKQ